MHGRSSGGLTTHLTNPSLAHPLPHARRPLPLHRRHGSKLRLRAGMSRGEATNLQLVARQPRCPISLHQLSCRLVLQHLAHPRHSADNIM